jgi:hypothetical protein
MPSKGGFWLAAFKPHSTTLDRHRNSRAALELLDKNGTPEQHDNSSPNSVPNDNKLHKPVPNRLRTSVFNADPTSKLAVKMFGSKLSAETEAIRHVRTMSNLSHGWLIACSWQCC